jgi:hypothetical protein
MMKHHPLAKPTVYIDDIPSLRLRRALARFVGPKRRLRKMLGAAGVLIVLAGGIGVLYNSQPAEETGASTHRTTCNRG